MESVLIIIISVLVFILFTFIATHNKYWEYIISVHQKCLINNQKTYKNICHDCKDKQREIYDMCKTVNYIKHMEKAGE